MFRLHVEGVGSVLQNAGTEVFEFSRIRVHVRAQEIRLTDISTCFQCAQATNSSVASEGVCYKCSEGRPEEVGPIEQEVGTAVSLFFFSRIGSACVTGIEEPA